MVTTTRPDAQLVQACRAGDEDAWSELVQRYAPLILSVPRRYGLKAAQSEDVFAEVCLALVKSLPSLRDPAALPAWLIRTASRATWETARKAKLTTNPELPPLTGSAPPVDFVEALEEEHLVRQSLAHLSERCRKLLTQLYFTEPAPDYDALAVTMGMPRGSLGPTRRRCLDRMRKWLEPRLGGDVSSGLARPPRS